MHEATALAAVTVRPPFGLPWVERYLPHYLTAPPSALHVALAADLAEAATTRGVRRNLIAPRGSAKTTWLSKAFPLRQALEGAEPLTLLLAETGEQAKSYLDAIKDELETNPAILRDYPESAGRGRIWQANRIRLRNGCEIVARGAGGRVLGMTRKSRRPTLVVLDDGNSRGDAYSPTTRRRKIDWFTKDVLPAGEPGTNVFVAGTPIHREAIVCALRDAGWQTRRYSALPRDPDRLDLWREWERLRLNLADPAREATARGFYDANVADMDAGAELLWPERIPLYAVMEYRALYGEAAYRSEYTDDPGAAEGAEWPPEYFDRPGFWFDEWPDDLTHRLIALDPSKGSDGSGRDYQAHALLGLGRDGTIYVDGDLRRETPEAMCRRTVALAREFAPPPLRCDSIIVEDNGTLGLIRVAMELAVGANLLPWNTLTNTGRKDVRIRAVGPYLARGQIKVRNTPGGRLLVQQWREFPFGDHDDGPDAVATGLIELELISQPGELARRRSGRR